MKQYDVIRGYAKETVYYKAEDNDTKESMMEQAQKIVDDSYFGGYVNWVTDTGASVTVYTD